MIWSGLYGVGVLIPGSDRVLYCLGSFVGLFRDGFLFVDLLRVGGDGGAGVRGPASVPRADGPPPRDRRGA